MRFCAETSILKGSDGTGVMMSDKVFDQIMHIRDSAKHNMLDVTGIQREAFELGFHELVIYLLEHRNEYVRFILTGES